ncbi:unnamed protein product [Cunninghamella blakesleeana]
MLDRQHDDLHKLLPKSKQILSTLKKWIKENEGEKDMVDFSSYCINHISVWVDNPSVNEENLNKCKLINELFNINTNNDNGGIETTLTKKEIYCIMIKCHLLNNIALGRDINNKNTNNNNNNNTSNNNSSNNKNSYVPSKIDNSTAADGDYENTKNK